MRRVMMRNCFAGRGEPNPGGRIMEDARTTFLTALGNWLGSNRLIVLAGALTTLF
jgi:hypothetical protein